MPMLLSHCFHYTNILSLARRTQMMLLRYIQSPSRPNLLSLRRRSRRPRLHLVPPGPRDVVTIESSDSDGMDLSNFFKNRSGVFFLGGGLMIGRVPTTSLHLGIFRYTFAEMMMVLTVMMMNSVISSLLMSAFLN